MTAIADTQQRPEIAPASWVSVEHILRFPIAADDYTLTIRDEFLNGVKGLAPHLEDCARKTFDVVSTPNWGLEWGLPGWVGKTLALPRTTIDSLVLANIYMLAFARVTDDLVDGEHARREGGANDAAVTTAALHHLWMTEYVRVFEHAGLSGTAKFWTCFQEYVAEWLGVLWPGKQDMDRPFHSYDQSDWMKLAWRGSPIKVCCAAACLLSGRREMLAPLTTAVDNIMIAVAMLDDVFDWLEDLEANRYNAFVAYCSALPQTPQNAQANRHAVLEEIHLGKLAHPYYLVMYDRLRQAAEKCQCSGLAGFAGWLEDECRRCSDALVEQAHARILDAIRAARKIDFGER